MKINVEMADKFLFSDESHREVLCRDFKLDAILKIFILTAV